MKAIMLRGGKHAIVDDDFPDDIMKWKWRVSTTGYPVTTMMVKYRSYTIMLHHVVLEGSRDGMVVDHKNGDKLDNRKKNLRYCSQKENMQNRRMPKNNTSGYKGVHPSRGRWRAVITSSKKVYHLGYFDDKEEAARAYDEAALKYHGEFARLNVIN